MSVWRFPLAETGSPTVTAPSGAPAPFDVGRVRRDFPILQSRVHGQPLVYLDNAATTQRPNAVLDAMADFYRGQNANIHRGVHQLSEWATDAYEGARRTVQRFINAQDPAECVFVRGTTEAVNLVAQAWARPRLAPGDRVLVTGMEHHSNLVPWQVVCEQTGASLDVVPVRPDGDLDLEALGRLLTSRTRVLALTHTSNVLGTINPVRRLADMAHAAGAVVLVDAAQAVAHTPVDVRELGCDFLAFSGHKMFGPFGIGVLFGRRELLESMPPWQTGGGMVGRVRVEKTTFAPLPHRFEAGTPSVADAVGLAAAVEYLGGLGFEAVQAWEKVLTVRALDELAAVPGVRVLGAPRHRAGVISLVMDQAHPHDAATILDQEGVAARAGHHCAQPLMDAFGVPGTLRVSVAFYNTPEEIGILVRALHRVADILG